MKIKLVEAYVITKESERRLTKAIAKQFPVREFGKRGFRLENGQPVDEPICKVRGETLGLVGTWYYLVEDVKAGYIWEHAFIVKENYAKILAKRGVHADDPSQVPTAIL